MRISDSHRLLFVHVPKTGGATLERVFDDGIADVRFERGTRHDTLTQILKVDPELSGYWIVGFVRNPWARLVSWWSMIDTGRRRAAEGSEPHIRKFETYEVWAKVREYPDFETFVTRGGDEIERIRTPQFEFLATPDRRADFIGRTETMEGDVERIRDRLGLPLEAKLPHKNRSTHGHYRDYYTPVTRDRVAALYQRDIDEFGYEF
ncbi:MAG: sulfotransferase family 2 domain-containing protein [Nocardioidaceae bacterium]